MRRLIVLSGLWLTSSALAENGVVGWTRDGASFVYDAADETGSEGDSGKSGTADLAVVVDAKSRELKQYLLALGDATAAEKKRYQSLADRQAFKTWLAANPAACAAGRQSPDGKSRASITVSGEGFSVAWRHGRFEIAPSEDDVSPEAFKAELVVSRDGKPWPAASFEGRVAFYGTGQGATVTLCWSPDGRGVAWVTHTEHTMRDPAEEELRISFPDGPALEPERIRTAATRQSMLARRANVAGMKAYRAKNYVVATKKFRDAVAADASFVTAHYNLACVSALQGDKKTALAELQWLSVSSDPAAKAKLEKAATDPDLRSLAADPDAKPFFTR